MRPITPTETMLGHLGTFSMHKDGVLELRDNSPRINHLPQSVWHRICAAIRHLFGITTREEHALADLVVRAVIYLPIYTTKESRRWN
ncbi:MAG: hypothetical protein JSR76_05440 [Verrucomicrobia bacterium]|nr:hypothetical protein [Verrucomicrobiota bacterium]